MCSDTLPFHLLSSLMTVTADSDSFGAFQKQPVNFPLNHDKQATTTKHFKRPKKKKKKNQKNRPKNQTNITQKRINGRCCCCCCVYINHMSEKKVSVFWSLKPLLITLQKDIFFLVLFGFNHKHSFLFQWPSHNFLFLFC